MTLLEEVTGVTKTGEIKSTKGIHALLICMGGTFQALQNEFITIWIERVNRSNVYLATNVNLASFIALTNYGSEAIQSDAKFGMIANCQLSEDSNVQLNEGEVLKFKIEGLRPAEKYAVYGLEDAESSYEFYTFDRKTIASEDVQRKVSVENSELTVFAVTSINEIAVEFGNGATVRYSPFELRAISRDIDPIFAVKFDGTVSQGIDNKIILPTVGIASLEFQKDAGTLVEITSRISKNLLEIE